MCTRPPEDVAGENGACPIIEPIALRENVLTPSKRRAFFRYRVNFASGYPSGKCGNLHGGHRRIDALSGAGLQGDAEALSVRIC